MPSGDRIGGLSVLVPAGGSLAGRALGPALPLHGAALELPAGSGLAISAIARFYAADPQVAEVVVLVDQPPQRIKRLPPLVRLVTVPPQPHICGTLRAGLAAVHQPWVLVNPITTLPNLPAQPALAIQLGDQPLLPEGWAWLEPAAEGEGSAGRPRLRGKHQAAGEQLAAARLPFSGILTARRELLERALAAVDGDDLALVAAWLLEQGEEPVALPQAPWLDLGHRATLAASRRSRLSSRAFNRLSYCRARDLIVKRSADTERLAAERAYLEALPPQLARHFPALLPASPEPDGAVELGLEYVPLPSLAELYLHWRIGPNAWVGLLERLAAVLADFAAAGPPLQGPAPWLYGHKLESRWRQLMAQDSPALAAWRHGELRLNGRVLPSLERGVAELLAALEPLQGHCQLQPIHGDLCFNNILADPIGHSLRLIDPRGELPPGGLPRGYGDRRYDLIKLEHSVRGHYDAVVNDLFAVRLVDGQLELAIDQPPHRALVIELFEQRLLAGSLAERPRQLLLASLFLSMLPLHSEDPQRQLALAALGMASVYEPALLEGLGVNGARRSTALNEIRREGS